jgi:hypothetical protein
MVAGYSRTVLGAQEAVAMQWAKGMISGPKKRRFDVHVITLGEILKGVMMAEQTLFDSQTEPMLPERPDLQLAEPITAIDESIINQIEVAANLAPRLEKAILKITAAIAYSEDWTEQDGMACLASAGAERFLKHFEIRFEDLVSEKENWRDDNGEAYRWTFNGYAMWKGRRVPCMGQFSTREPFLGKSGGEWRDLKDIDEADIRSAAYHICIGNGIKALLGLRRIPVADLIAAGVSREKIKNISKTRSQGSQGGVSAPERDDQNRLWDMCLELCNGDDKEARSFLAMQSAYTNKKTGKEVEGATDVRRLSRGRLAVTLSKVDKEFKSQKGQG